MKRKFEAKFLNTILNEDDPLKKLQEMDLPMDNEEISRLIDLFMRESSGYNRSFAEDEKMIFSTEALYFLMDILRTGDISVDKFERIIGFGIVMNYFNKTQINIEGVNQIIDRIAIFENADFISSDILKIPNKNDFKNNNIILN